MTKSSKKKSSLMQSLRAHQAQAEIAARKKAQEATYAPAVAGKKRKRSSGASEAASTSPNTVASSSSNKGKGKATVPFYSGRRVLLVGEGNFSFALSMLVTDAVPVTPSLLIATSYDSESTCFEKYPEAQGIVERIRSLGTTVYFDVDAAKLDKHKDLRKLVYDTVVFNFPHVGAGIKDQDRNIVINQKLIVDFFQSTAPLLAKGKDPSSAPGSSKKRKRKSSPGSEDEDGNDDVSDLEAEPEEDINPVRRPPPTRGTVLITLRESPPYTLWDITRLAKDAPARKGYNQSSHHYKLVRSFVFRPDVYEGYEHRRTIGGATGLAPNEDLRKGQGTCRTWEFVLKDKGDPEYVGVKNPNAKALVL